MRDLKIGLDIDDCLCYWWESYCEYYNVKKYPSRLKEHQITKNVVRDLKTNRQFWITLPVKNKIDFIPVLYCTARVNNKAWSKKWLKDNGFPNSPVYQMYGHRVDKSKRIKGKVDVFIDDSIHNMIQLNLAGVPCLLYSTPNNQSWGEIGRITSLDYDTICKAYDEFMEKHFYNFKDLV